MRNRNEKQLYSLGSNVKYVLTVIWKNDRILLAYLLLEFICGVAAPFFGIYLPKLVVDLIGAQVTPRQLIVSLGGFTFAMAGLSMLHKFSSTAKYLRYNDLRQDCLSWIFEKSLHCDYIQLESDEGRTRHEKAQANTQNGDQSGFNIMMDNLSGFAVSALSFFLYSGVIGSLSPVVLLLLIATAIINFFALRYVRIYREKLIPVQTPVDMRLNYISKVTSDFSYGKDIRIYRMKAMIIEMRNTLLLALEAIQRKSQNKQYFAHFINALLVLLRDGAAYVYLIIMAANHTITIGEFLLYFGAIAGFAGWVTKVINSFDNMGFSSMKLGFMRDFLEQSNAPDPVPILTIPKNTSLGIEFRHVSFSYTTGGEKVLDDFSFVIQPGEKIALVGVNGAGKTTIVKLLCGFYQPDAGQILVGGVDIAFVKKTELFEQFSAVFQDILILPYTIAENVSLKTMEKTDKVRVGHCLEQAGLLKHIESLPKGIDSPMLRLSEEDGVILSGGQQQRLLLARALYKDASVLLLDEPTAALDPIAESEVYERYHDFAGRKTSIFISHRLASTRFCDRIVFLANGKPMEVGSHEELMQRNGKYAQMFEIQSRYYKTNAVWEGDERLETV